MRITKSVLLLSLVIIILAGAAYGIWSIVSMPGPHEWSDKERRVLKSLWLGSLPELPPDPSNAVADIGYPELDSTEIIAREKNLKGSFAPPFRGSRP